MWWCKRHRAATRGPNKSAAAQRRATLLCRPAAHVGRLRNKPGSRSAGKTTLIPMRELEQAARCLMSFPKVDLSKIVRVLCNGAGIPLVSSLRDRLRNPATRRPMFDPHPAPNCSYLWQKVGHCIPLWAGLQSTVAGHTVDFQRGAILDSGSVMSVAPPHRLKGRVPPERRRGADAAAGARRARGVSMNCMRMLLPTANWPNIREFRP